MDNRGFGVRRQEDRDISREPRPTSGPKRQTIARITGTLPKEPKPLEDAASSSYLSSAGFGNKWSQDVEYK